MKRLTLGMGVLGLVLGQIQIAYAGRVRTVYTNDKVMAPVSLALGRSTVLRLDDKPKTAVIGNQNYFSIEYLGNDITIQPQGRASTNLFVYTEYQTYGLILSVGNETGYDDLVYVKWRPGYLNIAEKKQKKIELLGNTEIQERLEIRDLIRVDVNRAIQSLAQGIVVVELELTNLSKEAIKTNEIQLSLSSAGTNLGKTQPYQKVAIKLEEIPPGGKTDARLIVKLPELESNSVVAVSVRGKTGKVALSSKRKRK